MLIVAVCLAGMLPACGCITREVDFIPKITDLPGDGVCIPIMLEDGLLFVEATINGCGPYRFLFDTGAPPLVVSDEVARELDLPTTCKRAVGIDPDGVKSAPRAVVAVGTLALGDAVFRELHASVKDMDEFHRMGLECDGVVGLLPFKNCLVSIDFPNRQLRLERGRLVEPGNPLERLRVPATDFTEGVPRVPVYILLGAADPVLFMMTVDTGFNGGVAMPAEAKAHPSPRLEVGEATSVMAEGRRVQRRNFELDARVIVGGLVCENPVVAYVDGCYGSIGTRVLHSYVLTFDQAHGLTRFASSEPLGR